MELAILIICVIASGLIGFASYTLSQRFKGSLKIHVIGLAIGGTFSVALTIAMKAAYIYYIK